MKGNLNGNRCKCNAMTCDAIKLHGMKLKIERGCNDNWIANVGHRLFSQKGEICPLYGLGGP